MEIENTAIFRKLIRNSVEKYVPLNIMMELTYNCNLNCKYCYIDPPDNKTELTISEYEELIRSLKKAGTFIITLTGGDPAGYQNFWPLLRIISEEGLLIRLLTSGIFINKYNIRDLKSFNLLGVELSLYGSTPEENDPLMGAGAFGRITSAVKLLREQMIPVVLKMTVSKDNLDYVSKVYQICRELDAEFKYSPWLTLKRDGSDDNKKLRLQKDDLPKLAREFEMAGECSRPKTSARKREDILSEYICLAGINECRIDPYGTVYPCVDLNLPAGNIREQPFMEIWENSETLIMLRGLRKKDAKECTECKLLSTCIRCPGMSLAENGDIFAPNELACLLAEE